MTKIFSLSLTTKKNKKEIKVMVDCSLCGAPLDDFGHNPWPLALNEKERCCDKCNIEKVVPARIEMLYNNG